MAEKRQAAMRSKRIGAIPRIIAVCALHASTNIDQYMQSLAVDGVTVAGTGTGRYEVHCPAQRVNFTFLPLVPDPVTTLDILAIAEGVHVCVAADDGQLLLDEQGRRLCELLTASGTSVCAHLLGGASTVKLPIEMHVLGANWIRQTLEHLRAPRWRCARSYLLADRVECDDLAEDEEEVSVRVYGALRGMPMYLHSLVYIPGTGTCRLRAVRSEEVPAGCTVDVSKQDSLQEEPEADVLMGEQTWPTAEEVQDQDQDEGSEEEDEEEVHGSDDEEVEEDPEALMEAYLGNTIPGTGKAAQAGPGSGTTAPTGPGTGTKPSSGTPILTEEDLLDDRVDCTGNARDRYARYRSLRSLRTSFWHSKDSLPEQYKRVFQLDDARALQKAVASQCEQIARLPTGSSGLLIDGTEHLRSEQYVEMIITVPRSKADGLIARGNAGILSVFALHADEVKRSVLHYSLTCCASYTSSAVPLRSKETVCVYAGFRCFWTKPVFSEGNLNSDKHKYLRCLPVSHSRAS